jgi:hypothetical protein
MLSQQSPGELLLDLKGHVFESAALSAYSYRPEFQNLGRLQPRESQIRAQRRWIHGADRPIQQTQEILKVAAE